MARIQHEHWKVYGNVFDQFTINDIIKLTKQGHFDQLVSPISIGKEANIFSAKKGSKYNIVKIYRLESCNFNKMYDYIKHDSRYYNIKRQRRQIIFSWVQREFRNIMKAREAGVKVPMPIITQHHIMVMQLIGNEKTGHTAQRLKQSAPKHPQIFFKELVKNITLLYQKAKLVHADLSEYNILNHNEKPVIIDMSQATPTDSANADELLERDIKNMVNYFKKHGIKTNHEKLKKQITQLK
ncbi:serine/threonine protein kinase [Candidatus Woesearchaeota archaeon CG10_big_fil_rev_8_21_14_0_10_34_8]|nr:MAG: serine/threonine protein kinase [Candidatus Woesearchaeota archaeon CG10_big_fil_rev_8_21_14_0_10_34_8]